MLELTSKLEDKDLERTMKIKKESGAKPEFQIGENEKVERVERGEREVPREQSKLRSRSLQKSRSKSHQSLRCTNGVKHCQCDTIDPSSFHRDCTGLRTRKLLKKTIEAYLCGRMTEFWKFWKFFEHFEHYIN